MAYYVALGKKKNFLGWVSAENDREAIERMDIGEGSPMSIFDEPVYFLARETSMDLIIIRR